MASDYDTECVAEAPRKPQRLAPAPVATPNDEAEVAAAEGASPAVHSARGSILVVDDNDDNRALAQETLEDGGHEVVCASDGAQALAILAERSFDCVLLDVRMPKIGGIEVAQRLRATPQGRHTAVIFLTALRDVATFDAAQRAGGDDFLTKPVRPTELASRVHAALRLSRLGAAVDEQGAILRQQRDDLLRAQLQTERLTAFIVHDLKNPVNAMDLTAQALAMDPTLSTGARASVGRIRTSARKLNHLILNLLDLSKSHEGTLVPNAQRLDATSLVSATLEDNRANADAKRVALDMRIERAFFRGDADLIGRALDNLIGNALRFAPSDSTVQVNVQGREGHTELSVTDEGPGIPAVSRERVFDVHFRLERDEQAGRAGHGLGLAFCRAVALAHGGTIFVVPSDHGTTVCIRLPDAASDSSLS